MTQLFAAISRRSDILPWRHWAGGAASGLAVVVRWLFLVTVFVLPLDAYLTLPGHASGVFLSQVLAIETAILLALALLIGRLAGQMPDLRVHWRDLVPLGLVLLAGMASAVEASSKGDVLKGCLKIVVFLGIYVTARAVRGAPDIRLHALGAVLGGLVIVVLLGLLQTRQSGTDITATLLNIQRSTAGLSAGTVVRAEATFRYPNELAAYLLLVLSLLAVCAARIPWALERSLSLALLAISLWLLVLTYTRGALVAALLVTPVLAWLVINWSALVREGWRALGAERRRLAVFIGIIVIGLAGIAVLGGHALVTRMTSLLSLNDTGYSTRFAAWHWAISAFLRHPLTGVGVNNLQIQPAAPVLDPLTGAREVDAENLFLNVLAEMGVVGLGAVVFCLVGALRRTWRALRTRRGDWVDQTWNVGVFVGICALLIYGIGDPVLASGQVTGLLCAFVGLVEPGKARRARPEATPPEPATELSAKER